jgi:hypothetical protein
MRNAGDKEAQPDKGDKIKNIIFSNAGENNPHWFPGVSEHMEMERSGMT